MASAAFEQPAMLAPFVIYDDAFLEVLGDESRLDKVIDADAHEGPVYVSSEDALYFTTLPKPTDAPTSGFKVAVKRLAQGDRFPLAQARLSVVIESANMANGMTLTEAGKLLIREQGSRAEHGRISRLGLKTGALETAIDAWRGLRLDSPSDVVKSDGTILVTILPNDPHDLNKLRMSTGASWPYLADADLHVQQTLDIREYTDSHHNATVPHTLILAPGLTDKVYVGYWFWGRPGRYDLWQDLRALHRRIKSDFDPTTPEARAAWEAPQ